MLNIERIYIADIQKYNSEIKKYQLCFCSATKYFGLFEDDELLGFFGIIKLKNKVIFKNDYILEKHRGKGYYKYMMNYRMFLAKSCGIRNPIIEATCTKYSIKTYLKYGFKVVQEYKNGCKKVIYEDIQ